MTEADREAMLKAIGISRLEELFSVVPDRVRLKRPLELPKPLSEPELFRYFRQLAGKNVDVGSVISFLGAGMYEHHIPAVVDYLLSRGEFVTAYTPYQAEISQGELQAAFEFQSMICQLTGMDVANSSMYDGATATAEAAGLACGATRRTRVLVSRAVHPEWRAVLRTYLHGLGYCMEEVPYESEGPESGRTSLSALQDALDDRVAAFIVQNPNFFGVIEDGAPMADAVHRVGGLLITAVNPVSLGVLKSPGDLGCRHRRRRCPAAGNAHGFRRPQLRIFCREKTVCAPYAGPHRRADGGPGRPARLCADTAGSGTAHPAGKGHVQYLFQPGVERLGGSHDHGRPGTQGLAELGRLNVQKAHYAHRRLSSLPGVAAPFAAPFFNEFVLRLPKPAESFLQAMVQAGILPGYHLGRDYPELTDRWLVAVTEVRTKEEVDEFVSAVEGWL